MTTNTFSTFTDSTLQTNVLETPPQNSLTTPNMTQQTVQLDTTTNSNSLQTSNHISQQTVTHATTNTNDLDAPLDWTDTTLTHLSLDIILKKIDGLEEKIDRILSILEMPKRANIKQKKLESIQILPIYPR